MSHALYIDRKQQKRLVTESLRVLGRGCTREQVLGWLAGTGMGCSASLFGRLYREVHPPQAPTLTIVLRLKSLDAAHDHKLLDAMARHQRLPEAAP